MFDFHCHLRGTITPALANKLAVRAAGKLPSWVGIENDCFVFNGFQEFLEVYHSVGHLATSAEALAWLAEEHLRAEAMRGVRYIELSISPGHLLENGIDISRCLKLLNIVSEKAFQECGIEARFIATLVRHGNDHDHVGLVESCIQHGGTRLVGIGLAGDELSAPLDKFVAAFALARSAGLNRTAHAGEFGSARDVIDAVELLDLQRVGHGIAARQDAAIMQELIARGVGFEICVSSNVKLAGYKSIDAHPLREMFNRGCRIALCSDDPGLLNTNISCEYAMILSSGILSKSELARLIVDGKRLAFDRSFYLTGPTFKEAQKWLLALNRTERLK